MEEVADLNSERDQQQQLQQQQQQQQQNQLDQQTKQQRQHQQQRNRRRERAQRMQAERDSRERGEVGGGSTTTTAAGSIVAASASAGTITSTITTSAAATTNNTIIDTTNTTQQQNASNLNNNNTNNLNSTVTSTITTTSATIVPTTNGNNSTIIGINNINNNNNINNRNSPIPTDNSNLTSTITNTHDGDTDNDSDESVDEDLLSTSSSSTMLIPRDKPPPRPPPPIRRKTNKIQQQQLQQQQQHHNHQQQLLLQQQQQHQQPSPLLEEDIIDGFAILAFKSYEDLEYAIKYAQKRKVKRLSALEELTTYVIEEKPPKIIDTGQRDRERDKDNRDREREWTSYQNNHIVNKNQNINNNNNTTSNHAQNNLINHTSHNSITLAQDAGTSDDSGRASERLTTSSVAPRDADSSRDRLSDASSRCSSGKGYICDSEGDDDKILFTFQLKMSNCPKCKCRRTCHCKDKTLTLDNINPYIKAAKHGGFTAILTRANEIEQEIIDGKPKPFSRIIKTAFGDIQAMGQQPLTFLRQVVALAMYPKLAEGRILADDVKKRVNDILRDCPGRTISGYAPSSGIPIIRRQVAEYIKNRDGYDADWEDVILSNGSSAAMRKIFQMFAAQLHCKPTGIMIPVPTFPIQKAIIAEFGLKGIEYYLDEDNGWSINIKELERAINAARPDFTPRAIIVINPGNPTGHVLTKQNIQAIIRFAYKSNLFVIADEVSQFNVYNEQSEFHSFKKVLMEMGAPYDSMELASFMSSSQGYMGECGFRAGYVELINVDVVVRHFFLLTMAYLVGTSTVGQVAISCYVCPPKRGETSYPKFIMEKTAILDSLKEKADLAYKFLNSLEGVKCSLIQGSLFAFPSLDLPEKAIYVASRKKMTPDSLYCLELLEETGICVLPGSGFGQKPGTYHYRITILLPIESFKKMLDSIEGFHKRFMARYTR